MLNGSQIVRLKFSSRQRFFCASRNYKMVISFRRSYRIEIYRGNIFGDKTFITAESAKFKSYATKKTQSKMTSVISRIITSYEKTSFSSEQIVSLRPEITLQISFSARSNLIESHADFKIGRTIN